MIVVAIGKLFWWYWCCHLSSHKYNFHQIPCFQTTCSATLILQIRNCVTNAVFSVVKTYIFVVEILFLWDWCCHLLHDIYNFHWNSMLSSGFFSSINHTRLWWLQNNVTLAALFFCCVNWPVFCQTLKVCWMHFCCRKKIHLFRKKKLTVAFYSRSLFKPGNSLETFLFLQLEFSGMNDVKLFFIAVTDFEAK
jgi:hypothetical protein